MRFKAGAVVMAAALVSVGACVPNLPQNNPIESSVWLDQNWDAETRWWYHHTSQGTLTFPIPYDWFVSLEQPEMSLFGAVPLLTDPEYMRRLGFIPSPASMGGERVRYGYGELEGKGGYEGRKPWNEAAFGGNPDGLPVGFAKLDAPYTDPVTGETVKKAGLGLTCAACHTGHLEYKGTDIRIDGGPAITNLDSLTKVAGVALFMTDALPFRFERFATRVLKRQGLPDTRANRDALHKAINAKIKEAEAGLIAQGKLVDSEKNVTEGFGRLDALNRIGNQVFYTDMLGGDAATTAMANSNLAPVTAPVNYPHIWDTSWFDWVQYDGSIMQPMVRNAGESLGVAARLNLVKPDYGQLYRSTAKLEQIHEMEMALAGPNPWKGKRAFKGLRAPNWPEHILGKIDPAKHAKGKRLYGELCQGCHYPSVESKDFWNPALWTKPNRAGQRYLKMNLIPLEEIGTDPGQASVLPTRQVKVPLYMGVDPGTLCNGKPTGAVTDTLFAYALGVVVEKTMDKWYDEHDTPPARRAEMNGYRPNCLQAPFAYKARPLDGIWATPPFLHNGSVPNLYEMLLPASERSKRFYLGNREFDPVKVGYVSDFIPGGTEIDTSTTGNSNSGHEFRDAPQGTRGVIGRGLSDDERWALVEYLKRPN